MRTRDITFSAPILTSGLDGFPERLEFVSEARRVVEAVRLPAIRSHHAWLDACNRLLLAEASGKIPHVELARIALNFAVLLEQRGEVRVRRYRRTDRAIAA